MLSPKKRFSFVVVAASAVVAIAIGLTVKVAALKSDATVSQSSPSSAAVLASAPASSGSVATPRPTNAAPTTLPVAISAGRNVAPTSAESVAATLERLTFGARFYEPATVSDVPAAGQPALAAFANWTQRYLAAPDARAKASLAAEGVALAQARREVFLDLIRANPASALALAVPATVRVQLPALVTERLEERVSGRGDLHVYATTPVPGAPAPAEPTFRTVTMAERSYRAYIFGRREGQSSKRDVSLAGVALDGALALSASPVRLLEAGETPDPGRGITRLCPVSGFAAATDAVSAGTVPSAEVGDTTVQLCHVEHVAELERRLVRAENRAGPYAGALVPEVFSAAAAATDAGDLARTEGALYPPEWTMGPKRVLVMAVDFPDLQGVPYLGGPVGNAAGVLGAFYNTGGAAEFFDRCSYGQTSLVVEASDVTGPLRIPKKASIYAAGGLVDSLFNDALAAARRAGYNPDNYDRLLVVFSNLGNFNNSRFDFGGLGEVGGRQLMLNGTLAPLAHEFGHTYGLRHANLWQTTDGTVTGAGSSVEYGDPSDVMGDGGSGYGNPNYAEFNMWSRNLLGWLPDSAVQTVVTSGTYRLTHFDNRPGDLNRTLALKIPGDVRGDSEHDYWIGVRQRPSYGFYASSATAYIIWGYHDVRPSDLLDMNPPTSSYPNPSDAGLAAGRTFSENGITITPAAVNSSAPLNEQVDVQIILGSTIRLSATEVDADRESGRVTITLNRSGVTTGQTHMRYGTVDGSARAGVDYTAVSGEVVWADGETAAKTIVVPLLTSPVVGSPTTFSVQISALPYGNGGVLGAAAAQIHLPGSGSVDTSFAASSLNLSSAGGVLRPDGSFVTTNLVQNYPTRVFQWLKLDEHGNVNPGYPAAGSSPGADQLQQLIALPDGKMLAFAMVMSNGSYLPTISRWNADGTPDPSFVYPAGLFSRINVLAVQPDGKILVGGDLPASSTGTPPPALARLLPDGALDTTFQFVQPQLTLADLSVSVNLLTLQPDGKILIGGHFFVPDASGGRGRNRAFARLNADGGFDQAFNNAVDAVWPTPSWGTPFASVIALQPDGRILVGGFLRGLGSDLGPALVRFLPDGSQDPTFHPNIVASSSAFDSRVTALLLQPDGRMVVSGDFTLVNGVSRVRVARLNSDGTVDPTFDSNFLTLLLTRYLPTGGTPPLITTLLAQPDGGLLAFFPVLYGPGLNNRVVRLLNNNLRPGIVQLDAPGVNAAPGATLTLAVRRVGGSDGAVTVNYATQAKAASEAAGDFVAQRGVLTWAAGDSAPKTISIPISASGLGKDFAFNLSLPLGGVFLGDVASTRVFIGGTPGALTVASPLTAAGEVGQAFNYAVATNSGSMAVVFDASGLPPGLSIDHATGRILGAPTTAGTFAVGLMATGPLGSGSATLTLTVTAPPPPPSTGHASFFSGEVALGHEIYYLAFPSQGNIFGYYAYLQDPHFIYHFDLGYEYWFDAQNAQNGIFFYDFASNSFFYTAPTFPFPYLYDFSLNAILYYFPDPNNPQRYNTNGVRYFYNFATGQIIVK